MKKKLICSSLLAIALFSGCDFDIDEENDDTSSSQSSLAPSTRPSIAPSIRPSVTPSTQPSSSTNHAPVVNAGVDRKVKVNKRVTIVGTASDSDGTISTIEWQKGSDVLATTLSFSYTPTEVGKDVLTLVVVDNDGKSAKDSVTITVEKEESDSNPFNDIKK